jgi:hypothetical protein
MRRNFGGGQHNKRETTRTCYSQGNMKKLFSTFFFFFFAASWQLEMHCRFCVVICSGTLALLQQVGLAIYTGCPKSPETTLRSYIMETFGRIKSALISSDYLSYGPGVPDIYIATQSRLRFFLGYPVYMLAVIS